MKKTTALFVHDGPIYKDKNGIYCSTNITEEMLSRYFCVAEKILVLIRTNAIDKTYQQAKLQAIKNPNIEIVELGNIVSIRGLLHKRKIKKIIEPTVLKSNLVFLRLPGITCNLVAEICKKHHKKYLVEEGGCAWDAYWNHGILGKIVAPYMEHAQKVTTKNASYATYVTNKYLQNRYPCNCKSIEASNVYLPPHDDNNLKDRLKKICSYKDCKNFTIGTIANVDVRYKGQEYIIKAIARLNKNGYAFRYELVGGGDQTFLRNLARKYDIEDSVVFKGQMLHKDIMEWLKTIDIYAQPSKQEGLPRSVIEAMSIGCPCIGSTTAGIPELLSEDMVFSNGKIEEIIKIISSLNKNILEKESKRGFNHAKKFNLNHLNSVRRSYFEKYKEDVAQ